VFVAEIGDRIVVAAAKGAPSKRGTVTAKVGTMLTVEWEDGHSSSFTPAPGSAWVEEADSPAGANTG
jgi:Domain of unknown function (DUF1918)